MWRKQRQVMVRQMASRGLDDANVLHAMNTVPREAFVPDDQHAHAYAEHALPIGHGQTISQPFVVAMMAHLADLKSTDRVLEIGTGSGYGAAVLSQLASHVDTVEWHPALAEQARMVLKKLGYENITVFQGDGSQGLSEQAPFDAIVVTAGAPQVPTALKEQLTVGGRLVIPVGNMENRQILLRIQRVTEDQFETLQAAPVAFVPLVGKSGWQTTPNPS